MHIKLFINKDHQFSVFSSGINSLTLKVSSFLVIQLYELSNTNSSEKQQNIRLLERLHKMTVSIEKSLRFKFRI